MLKTEALHLLGGTATEAARLIGITPQAINGWPDVLTSKQRDRVQAALYRMRKVRPRSESKPKAADHHTRAA